jgi:hypothetical protein
MEFSRNSSAEKRMCNMIGNGAILLQLKDWVGADSTSL